MSEPFRFTKQMTEDLEDGKFPEKDTLNLRPDDGADFSGPGGDG